MWKRFISNPFVKFLASLKLAVCVILSFAVLMTWGTLIESTHNAQFAQWKVYFSPVFIAVEILLFVNILFAALVRIPFRKKLTGFYITHLGLLTLMVGATLTAVTGVDGSLRLLPNQPSNAVVINEPHFYAFFNSAGGMDPVEFTAPLPKTVNPKRQLGKVFLELMDYDVYIEEFLPFASPHYSWKPHPDPATQSRFISLQLKNAMMAQQVDLSTFSQEDSSKKMGPLTLSLLSRISHDCFESALTNSALYLFQMGDHCLTFDTPQSTPITQNNITVRKLKDEPFLKLEIKTSDGTTLVFYPQLSSSPVTQDIKIDDKSEAYLLKLDSYIKDPHVIVFRNNQLGYGKTEWKFEPLELNKLYKLPWMGLELTPNKWIDNKYQHVEWFYQPPRQGDQEERHYAAKVRLQHRFNVDDVHSFWVDDTGLKKITTKSGFEFEFLCGRKLHHLPFTVALDQFKMNTNPGTMDPASYESFVTVTENEKTTKEHIFMNNPMKRDKYTLYQASYFQIDEKNFGSVLSVNHDPGRPLKYTGSFLIVFGSILHFIIRSRQ